LVDSPIFREKYPPRTIHRADGRDEQERHGDVRDEPTVKHDVAASPSAR
jgi:hypothetical protein